MNVQDDQPQLRWDNLSFLLTEDQREYPRQMPSYSLQIKGLKDRSRTSEKVEESSTVGERDPQNRQ